MSERFVVDPPQLDLLLKQLRLPTKRTLWRSFSERADRQGWPAALRAAPGRGEAAAGQDARQLRLHPRARGVKGARGSPGERRHLARGGRKRASFRPARNGQEKSHLAAGLGLRLVENGFRVLYQRTANLVQKLQAARRDLALEGAIRKLYKYHLLILDDFSYVTSESAETSVLFELIGARYENRSLLVIANEPFSAWGRIFGGDAMTLAAVDRLVHRSHIFELNVESYRRRAAIAARQAAAREPADENQEGRPESG